MTIRVDLRIDVLYIPCRGWMFFVSAFPRGEGIIAVLGMAVERNKVFLELDAKVELDRSMGIVVIIFLMLMFAILQH